MAGHSKFKNIMHRKGAQDKRRAKVFTTRIKEIIAAAKTGQIDPIFNPRLRLAINAAKVLNVPKDRIENALKRAVSGLQSDNYEEMRYEGYAPGGIALIVECLTDNKNRTAPEVRAAFTKYGGNLGETGSVNFMFDHVGVLSFAKTTSDKEELFELAANAGADDCEMDGEYYEIFCTPSDLNIMRENLSSVLGDPFEMKFTWRPKNTILIDDELQAEKLMKLLEHLDDIDDVSEVYGNYEFSEKFIDKI